ncbi:MAG: cell division protein FtsQ [Candidatus Midichloriaceae bacterium]|jgi:cell division protein FtsQ
MIRITILKYSLLFIFLFIGFFFIQKSNEIRKITTIITNLGQNHTILHEIQLRGNNFLSNSKILDLINIKEGMKLYDISPSDIRKILLSQKEVKDITVKLNYTGILEVDITERKPFAILWNDNIPTIIDEEGNTIQIISNIKPYNHLIIIFGKNISNKLKKFLDLINKNSIYKNIISLHHINGRRWDVYMKNSVIIKFPENNVEAAMQFSDKILNSINYKEKIAILDLRLYPKRVFLRLKEHT